MNIIVVIAFFGVLMLAKMFNAMSMSAFMHKQEDTSAGLFVLAMCSELLATAAFTVAVFQ